MQEKKYTVHHKYQKWFFNPRVKLEQQSLMDNEIYNYISEYLLIDGVGAGTNMFLILNKEREICSTTMSKQSLFNICK